MSVFIVNVGGRFHSKTFPSIEDAKSHVQKNYNYNEYPELLHSATTIYEVITILEKHVTTTVTWIENKGAK